LRDISIDRSKAISLFLLLEHIMRVSLYFFLAAFLFGALLADYMVTSSARNAVIAACETKVADDKSGDVYCMDIPSMRKHSRP
jgi:hypothetical protein